MGTINQPKPSQPKSPSHDTPPLQPGHTHTSTAEEQPTRIMPEAQNALRDELDNAEEAARRRR